MWISNISRQNQEQTTIVLITCIETSPDNKITWTLIVQSWTKLGKNISNYENDFFQSIIFHISCLLYIHINTHLWIQSLHVTAYTFSQVLCTLVQSVKELLMFHMNTLTGWKHKSLLEWNMHNSWYIEMRSCYLFIDICLVFSIFSLAIIWNSLESSHGRGPRMLCQASKSDRRIFCKDETSTKIIIMIITLYKAHFI